MKKSAVLFLTATILFGNQAFFALAQTSTTSSSVTQLQALIETLKQQAADLQSKFEAQQKAAADVRAAATAVRGTLTLIRQLKQGMSGDDIKILQAILAADPEIYPEGKITGFFGRLTAMAVRRFQKKHGLSQVGNVGPKTLEKLMKELDKNPLAEEKDEIGEGKHACAIVPPGHIIAPGWLKKNEKPVVPQCQKLPPGIAAQLEPSSSTPSSTDNVAPIISGVVSSNLTHNSVVINWNTNEPADSAIWYSTSTPVSTTSTPRFLSLSLVVNHGAALTGLSALTTYYFVVGSKDASGNLAKSAEFSFMTPPVPDTTAPIISGVSAANVSSSSADIVWSTNELASSRVWYSTSSPVQATGTTPSAVSSTLVASHDILLSSLNASTTYYFVVESSDGSGNRSLAPESSFMTAGQ